MVTDQTNLAWATLLDLGSPGLGRLTRHERLTRALRTAIRDGRVGPGSAVPPSRALAEEIGCSRWVVTEAYAQLAAEGYLTARRGSATRVAWSPEPATSRTPPVRAPVAPSPRFDLTPGLPDLRAFPRRRWAEVVRAAVNSIDRHDLGQPDPAGHVTLRATMAQYLRRSRSAESRTEDITICAGITDGLRRTCRTVRAGGGTVLAVEEPGWRRLHDAAREAGLRVHPVPVDDDGLRVDHLARTGAAAVLVGPAHQFPTGTVLSPQRRGELVRWAHDTDALVIEDDYDAEFRYDHRPLGVVQALDPRRVVLLGSVSKTLSPALGLGWLLAPTALVPTLRAANRTAAAPPVLDQLALALFLDRGWYDGHLRAARRRFRRRRELLVDTLGAVLPAGRITDSAAGLHVLLGLPAGTDTALVVSAARRSGLDLVDLAAYCSDPQVRPTLVLGYGNITDVEIPVAVARLRAAITVGSPGLPPAPPDSSTAGRRRAPHGRCG